MRLLLFALLAAQDPAPASHLGAWERTIHGLDRPESVAIDGSGRLWVAEAGAGRVRVFARGGEELARIETGLVEPVEVLDLEQGMIVLDRSGPRTARATLTGTAEPLQVDRVRLLLPEALTDLAVLADGGCLVTDRDHHRLRRLDPDGAEVASTGGFGFFEGLFASPGGLDVAGGRVFVADTENHRIQVFDLERIRPREGPALPVPPLYTFGVHALRPREGRGSMHYPADVAVADDRSWAAVCEPWDDRVQVFGRAPGARPAADPLRSGVGQASTHYGRRLAVDGTLMTIVQPETRSIEVFDLRLLPGERRNDPIRISVFGGLGDRLGMFRRPEGMDLRIEDRSLLVCDAGNRRLVEVRLDVDPTGEVAQDYEMARFVRSIDLGDSTPLAVRRARGEVFVLVTHDPLQYTAVLVLDEPTWRRRGRVGDDELDRPTDLAVTPDGQRVLVACADGVRVLSRAGEDLGLIGADELDEPFGVLVAPDGTVVVTDSGAHALLRFSIEGELLGRWGSKGIQRGELYHPSGVALSGAGEMYVIDHANHRGLITTLAGEYRHAFGSRAYTRPAKDPASYRPQDFVE